MRPYYKVPLNFSTINRKERHPLCENDESIKQHIHLILSTHYQEYRYDFTYGCYVWDKDYETIHSVSKWKKELHNSILEAITSNEARLSGVKINLDIDEPKVLDSKTRKVIKLRKRIMIKISGVITKTNELFAHDEYIFFSPLSLN